MIFRFIILIMIFAFYSAESLEKKAFTFHDMLKFQTIQEAKISENGKWIAYAQNPERGDGSGYVRSVTDTSVFKIERGSNPTFAKSSNWIAFKRKPKAVELENADKNKPKDGLTIVNLFDGSQNEIDNVSAFTFSNNGVWIAYKPSEDPDKKSGDEDKNKKKPAGSKLVLHHLESGTEIINNDVVEYLFDSLSYYFIYIVSDKSGKRDGLYYRDLSKPFCPENVIYAEKNIAVSNLEWNNQRKQLGYITSGLGKDGEPYKGSLWIWESATKSIKSVIAAESVEKDWYIPYKNKLSWNESGSRLYFGMKPESERFAEDLKKVNFNDTTFYNLDSILTKTELRVWHWNDDLINPNQEKNWDNKKNKHYTAIYLSDSGKVQRLADTLVDEVYFGENGNFTLAYGTKPYLKDITWDGWYHDLYKINIKTGDKKILRKRLSEKAHLSPNGRYAVFFENKHWYIYDMERDTLRNLTEKLDVNFWDEEHDLPAEPGPYGFGGWFENDDSFYLYDRYDVWRFAAESVGNMNATLGTGRDNKIEFRIVKLDEDKKYFGTKDTLILHGFDKKSKSSGLYAIETWVMGPIKLLEEDNYIMLRDYSKESKRILLSKEKYDLFPDLYISNISFDTVRKLTNVGDQIKQFAWGKAELLSWKNPKGDSLEGFIIKPDNYDPTKRYPVIIYFYERFSDLYNRFSTPRVNHRPSYPQYVSDGYVVFLPDIKYSNGNPGIDAVESLVSGAQKLVEMGIADKERIGIQGHSWGGYQTAFIVTQTNFFKAAVAGAPVGNMISAYSGIRLGTGLARQFQYEKEQSRIGGNLWDSLDNYLRNSPVIHANKAITPLLIMFGDEDEAVPWQQGIELYLSFRRLGKNCVMLQYLGEPHHPRKLHNQLDYAIKMKQWFDHYLKGAPAQAWMSEGIPFKGK